MRRPFVSLGLLLVLFLSRSYGADAEFTGRVVGVSDGDTITVLGIGNVQTKIRLHGIDAPEAKQAFGNVSKRTLSQLVYGSQLRVLPRDTDRYGRTVADVYKGEAWINRVLIERGMAWVYLEYSRDPNLLRAESFRASSSRRLVARREERCPVGMEALQMSWNPPKPRRSSPRGPRGLSGMAVTLLLYCSRGAAVTETLGATGPLLREAVRCVREAPRAQGVDGIELNSRLANGVPHGR
jgi:micrococcal nuclease